MRLARSWSCLSPLACALALACAGGSPPSVPAADPATPPAPSRPARTLALPEAQPQRPGEASAQPGLAWDAPPGWTAEPPQSSMRLAQYRVPGEGGDGECVVFYFGPGQGGDPTSNARRWAGQFQQPDGSSSLERMTSSVIEGAQLPVHLFEVTGTYDGGMTMTDAPAQSRDGFMLLGAIVETKDAPWFFKLTGPEPTLRAQRDAFVRMLRSAHVGE